MPVCSAPEALTMICSGQREAVKERNAYNQKELEKGRHRGKTIKMHKLEINVK